MTRLAAAVVDVSRDGIDNDDDLMIDSADSNELGTRALRFSLDHVEFSRWYRDEYDATGARVRHDVVGGKIKGNAAAVARANALEKCYGKGGNTTFFPFPYLLNAIAPPRMLMGRNGLFESTNGGDTFTLIQGETDCSLPDVTALAYGGREPNPLTPDPDDTRDVPDVVYVARGSEIYVRGKPDAAFSKHIATPNPN